MIEEIKAASKDNLVFCFAGVGSAFAKKNAQTSLIIAQNGITILVDIGTTIPTELAKHNIPVWAFDYYLITHSHADHAGGIEELLLLSRYVRKQKVKLIIPTPYYDILWDKTLRGGCEHNEGELLKFSDLVIPIGPRWLQSQPREIYEIIINDIQLQIFRTAHIPGDVQQWEKAFWSTGIMVNERVLYSGDTRFDKSLFTDTDTQSVETIFHDCQLFNPGTVHATYDELKTLPPAFKEKIKFVHYGDAYEKFIDQAKEDGFIDPFTKPWTIFKWPLNGG